MNYARLFNRIPDDVVLAVSSRDLELDDGSRCLCAWAVRETLARLRDCDADEITDFMPVTESEDRFGGTFDEWWDVYSNVRRPDILPLIETAWVNRLDKAVERAR